MTNETTASGCDFCGTAPCFLSCPTQDPYAGDQRREHEDHEFGAQFDDLRERFGPTADDADLFFESAAAFEEEKWEAEEAARIAAGLGPTLFSEPSAPALPVDDSDDIPF